MTTDRKVTETVEEVAPEAVEAGRRQPGPASARPDAERVEAGEPQAPEPPEAAAEVAPEDAAEVVDEDGPDADEGEVHDGELAADGEEVVESPPEDDFATQVAKAGEYLALAQRTQADFENYRKRATREAAIAQARGVIKLAKELLPAVDDLDRALAAAEAAGDGADEALVSGIKLVHADVIAALARVGIEQYSPEGERFDPQIHEAVAQQPFEGAEPGTVVEVYQRGYVLGDAVIRPARVVVAG